jgi:short-subunit dehydrogenase
VSAAPPRKYHRRYGEWAVVTGASDGIGRAFAGELAADGMSLVLVARRAAVLHELAQSLGRDHGVDCRALPLDLSRAEDNARLLHETADLPVGLLVAAAGFGTSGAFVGIALEQEINMLELNCRSTFVLARGYAERFVERQRGGIVLMSSLLAFQGVPLASHYAATKAYVQVLAEGLHRELRRQGIDVIASAPGPVATGFGARANMKMSVALPARTIARATLAALGGAPTVRPGWLSMLLEASLAPLPRRLRTTIMQQVMGGMTAHQAG